MHPDAIAAWLAGQIAASQQAASAAVAAPGVASQHWQQAALQLLHQQQAQQQAPPRSSFTSLLGLQLDAAALALQQNGGTSTHEEVER